MYLFAKPQQKTADIVLKTDKKSTVTQHCFCGHVAVQYTMTAAQFSLKTQTPHTVK